MEQTKDILTAVEMLTFSSLCTTGWIDAQERLSASVATCTSGIFTDISSCKNNFTGISVHQMQKKICQMQTFINLTYLTNVHHLEGSFAKIIPSDLRRKQWYEQEAELVVLPVTKHQTT